MPNKVQIIGDSFAFQFSAQSQYKVKIVDESNVLAGECASSADCAFNSKGTWDILYQESLLVQLENGMRFIANMQYRIRPDQLASPSSSPSASSAAQQPYTLPFSRFATIRAHDYDRFDEHCDSTMVGFVLSPASLWLSSFPFAFTHLPFRRWCPHCVKGKKK